MPEAYPKTCINSTPDGGLRCWWTYIPEAVKAGGSFQVPLMMDGGVGCASSQALWSGFRELSDELHYRLASGRHRLVGNLWVRLSPALGGGRGRGQGNLLG